MQDEVKQISCHKEKGTAMNLSETQDIRIFETDLTDDVLKELIRLSEDWEKEASVYGYRNAPCGVRVMLSRDMGKTWETDLVLWDKGVSADLGYPATVELNNGTLLTVFYAQDAADGPAVIKQIRWKLK